MEQNRINIEVIETVKIPKGKAFYDTFEKLLNYAVKSKGTFHSFVQSEFLSIDVDKSGNLLNVEVSVDRNRWEVVPDLAPPKSAGFRTLKFKDLRLNVHGETYRTGQARDFLHIRFRDDNHLQTYEVAENLLVDVNVVSELSGIWILHIDEDCGFKKEMAYRKGTASEKN